MAEELNIKQGWYHVDHYDIPKKRIVEIQSKCEIISSKEIVAIIKNKVKTSQKISYLLRHNPEDLIMDKKGYVDTEELLTKLEISFEVLEDIVATNDKKRFKFNDDKTKIRASQGHTLDIKIDFKEQTPPDILYHGVPVDKLKIIKKEGLKKMKRHDVHLSKDIETAANVGARRGKFKIAHIDAKQMKKDGYKFFISDNGVWLTSFVPTKYIKIV